MATYFWKILLRRATAAALFAPGGSPLSQGEPAYATDTKQLYVGNGDGTNTAIGGDAPALFFESEECRLTGDNLTAGVRLYALRFPARPDGGAFTFTPALLRFHCDGAPSGGPAQLNVLRNGVRVLGVPLSVAAGTTSAADVTAFGGVTWASGDDYSYEIVAVNGSDHWNILAVFSVA